MDHSSICSAVLFDALQRDLGIVAEPGGTRFNPFPSGFPTGLSVGDFARYALLQSAFKKSEIESAPDAEVRTLESFLRANAFCSTQTVEAFRSWDGSPAVGYSISKAKQLLEDWFNPGGFPAVSQGSIERQARFGPGRSVGLKEKPSLFYFKVGDSQMTATCAFIIDWYERSVSWNPVCEAAEMARKARHGQATVVKHGNFTFVPKSYSARRVVVTEPSLNTFFQLGLGAEMERVLRTNTGISFELQPQTNAELARIGSQTGDFATMDLKQCSDYISVALCEYLLPPSVVRWMKILRTPEVRMPDGEILPLSMMSTMGDGFTFPMQTVLLSSLVLGVYDTLDLPVKDSFGRRAWGVFGDDIIVVKEAFHLLTRVLTELGMIVNLDKSFVTGDFRESCGSDWYQGYDVRGVYIKKYTSDQDLYSAFNRLAVWSARQGIELPCTLATIINILVGVVVIPPDEPEDGGIQLPLPPSEPDNMGCWRYSVWVPRLSSISFEPWEILEFGDLPQGRKEWAKFQRWLGDLQRFCGGSVNEPALLKTLLAGGLRRKSMVARSGRQKTYRLMDRVTPRWGYSPRDRYPRVGSDEFYRLQAIVSQALTASL